jgi:hypothetical protein
LLFRRQAVVILLSAQSELLVLLPKGFVTVVQFLNLGMLSIQLLQYGAVLSSESVELRVGFNQADLGLD